MQFSNTYSSLPKNFFATTKPGLFPNASLLKYNNSLSKELGLNLEGKSNKELANIFSAQHLLENSKPIALAYAAHQFGYFVPQLGDGRALLLGEVLDPTGKRYDIQLKGSGQTAYSRNGDGLSALGPVIREYILSEAMHGLGVPTTRALAIVSTGELVHREKSFPGAIFTRVASSHIRVGTFQYFAAKGDVESVKTLLDYAIERHYPEIVTDHAISFLRAVIRKQISLVTHWMSLGFIHGVMNTDNMSISGETLDYGPCAFMDKFSHGKVFSSIDQNGRYAYNNQGNILLWNMARLAECLKPLVHADDQTAVKLLNKELESVSEDFQCELDKKMTAKLGLKSDNVDLINQFLNLLEQEGLDFTLSFRNICSLDSTHKSAGMMTFYNTWKQKLTADGTTIEKVAEKIRKVSPLYIPRNHQVELAIQGAMNDDLTVFNDINKVMQRPFEFQSQLDRYSLAPVPSEEVVATFCGT